MTDRLEQHAPPARRPVAVIAPAHARATAERLAEALAARLVVPKEGALASALRESFVQGETIVALCATGLVVRTLAPLLADKWQDPPVLCLSPDGRHIVPLLGGHHGANGLARRIAALTGGQAAITTASDSRLGTALDDPPAGWRLATDARTHLPAFIRGLLEGKGVRITGEPLPWLNATDLPLARTGPLEIHATIGASPSRPDRLVYHPRRLAVGLGMARNAAVKDVRALLDATLEEAGLAPEAIAAIGTLELKADEPALAALCAALAVPLRLFSAEELAAIPVPHPSRIVAAEVGTPSVAEAAALALAGKDGTLLVTKRKNAVATCAIAAAPAPLADLQALPGRPRGTLFVVGLGPGDAAHRTPAATRALQAAGHWVGYDLYLDLAADLARGRTLHPFPLGAEKERVRHALALAGEGHTVALLCSGDPGIYAMASLVMEMLEDPALPEACRRIRLEVIPGISAFQLAAARTGALIGHDFCAISLSDLLTPWDVIERRIRAAAQGDFVIAFYNPRSRRRTWQLEKALHILRTHRPPHTPAIIATSLARPAERIVHTTLESLDPQAVDMLSLVLVGNAESRRFTLPGGRPLAYTPRGYATRARCEDRREQPESMGESSDRSSPP